MLNNKNSDNHNLPIVCINQLNPIEINYFLQKLLICYLINNGFFDIKYKNTEERLCNLLKKIYNAKNAKSLDKTVDQITEKTDLLYQPFEIILSLSNKNIDFKYYYPILDDQNHRVSKINEIFNPIKINNMDQLTNKFTLYFCDIIRKLRYKTKFLEILETNDIGIKIFYIGNNTGIRNWVKNRNWDGEHLAMREKIRKVNLRNDQTAIEWLREHGLIQKPKVRLTETDFKGLEISDEQLLKKYRAIKPGTWEGRTYKGLKNTAVWEPFTRTLHFHKDCGPVSEPFHNILHYINNQPMYGPELINCINQRKPQKCGTLIRFGIPKHGIIGINDKLLAHSTPTHQIDDYSVLEHLPRRLWNKVREDLGEFGGNSYSVAKRFLPKPNDPIIQIVHTCKIDKMRNRLAKHEIDERDLDRDKQINEVAEIFSSCTEKIRTKILDIIREYLDEIMVMGAVHPNLIIMKKYRSRKNDKYFHYNNTGFINYKRSKFMRYWLYKIDKKKISGDKDTIRTTNVGDKKIEINCKPLIFDGIPRTKSININTLNNSQNIKNVNVNPDELEIKYPKFAKMNKESKANEIDGKMWEEYRSAISFTKKASEPEYNRWRC